MNSKEWPQNWQRKGIIPNKAVQEAWQNYEIVNRDEKILKSKIFALQSKSLQEVMLEHKNRFHDSLKQAAGKEAEGTPFYTTIFEPADFWKWFRGDSEERLRKIIEDKFTINRLIKKLNEDKEKINVKANEENLKEFTSTASSDEAKKKRKRTI